jgi:hypothetical protein
MWVELAPIRLIMRIIAPFFTVVVTFLACPRNVTKEGHPAKILYGMLGRPRYISETRPAGSDSPKCLTLGLGRLPRFFAWGLPQAPHVPGAAL